MQLQNAVHDPQSQPALAAGAPHRKWPLEEPFARALRNARTGIAHQHLDVGPHGRHRHRDLTARRGITQRVVEQVGEHALDQAQVGTRSRNLRGEFRSQRHTARFRTQFEFLKDVLNQIGHRERFSLGLHETMLQTCQFKKRLGQRADLAALVEGDAEIAPPLVGGERGVLERERFQIAVQRGQWRAQVVRDIGDELTPLLILTRERAPLCPEPLDHLPERPLQHHDLVVRTRLLRRQFVDRDDGQRHGCRIDIEVADGVREPPQRARNQRERRETGEAANRSCASPSSTT